MKPFPVQLHFQGDLSRFLRQRFDPGPDVERILPSRMGVKDVIESCGVPHPEVDLIVVADGPSRTLDFTGTVDGPTRLDLRGIPPLRRVRAIYWPGSHFDKLTARVARLTVPQV